MFAELGYWYAVRDGDPSALALYNRHYSAYRYADRRKRDRLVGPGERIVLLTTGRDALFVWRHSNRPDLGGRVGVYCSVFRNESAVRSSLLIREAMTFALCRWPGERLYTFVNPRAVRSSNPGYCFKVVGWRVVGVTKKRGYVELEYP